MKLKKLTAACGVALAAMFTAATPAQAQVSGDVIKIGFITDMASLYADIDGPGGVEAIKMAIADMGGAVDGKKVELVVADHQNKPDIGAVKAREWFDTEGLDMLIGGTNSGVNLAMAKVAAEKHKPFLAIGPGSSALTNAQCSPYTVHYAYDTVALAKGTGGAVVKAGGKSWFFLTADYAFGHALEADTSKVVKAAGGTVVGAVRVPLNASDFSSFLLQAQASKAQILGLANAGGDTINAIKQGAEFGIVAGGQKFAGLLVFAPDVAALGLKTAQGLTFTETFYWDLNDGTRAWTKRWDKERDAAGKLPSMNMAGVYAGTLHYLKAVAAVGSAADGKAVVEQMKKTPTDDPLFGKGTVRVDGRVLHPAYLFEVKKPEESKYPGDLYHLRTTIPADEAFRPLNEGKCPMVSG